MQSSGLVTTNKILFWVNKLDFLPKKKILDISIFHAQVHAAINSQEIRNILPLKDSTLFFQVISELFQE